MVDLWAMPPYALDKTEKKAAILPYFRELHQRHFVGCAAYRSISLACGKEAAADGIEGLPFLPVRLFKEYELHSVPKEKIVKTVVSSGTTDQTPSRIFLDKETAALQQKALVKIIADFIGNARMPMIILDSPAVLKNKNQFSTRGAGILGFSVFGTEKTYAFDEEMRLDMDAIREFLVRHQGKTILLFGFTFMIWQYFYKELRNQRKQLDLSNAVMIHGGGWKKLVDEAVSKEEFKQRFYEISRLSRIHENYGMAEQTGSIFVECECGNLHVSNYSEVIIRDPLNWRVCEVGERGIMQVMSVLPRSYPGYSLLTEDEGAILGEDNCACKRKGKYFSVLGRLKAAELRGCSDTYAAKFG